MEAIARAASVGDLDFVEIARTQDARYKPHRY